MGILCHIYDILMTGFEMGNDCRGIIVLVIIVLEIGGFRYRIDFLFLPFDHREHWILSCRNVICFTAAVWLFGTRLQQR